MNEGCRVIGISRTKADCDALEAEFGAGRVTCVCADLGQDPHGTMDKALSLCEDLDFLVNNAGVQKVEKLLDVSEEAWTNIMRVNAFVPLVAIQKAVKKMTRDGALAECPDKAIVNVSSQASLFSMDSHCSYSMSKGALDLLTKTACLELGKHKIRCNAVNPTVVLTELGSKEWGPGGNMGEKAINGMKGRIPLDQFAVEEDVSGPVLFLLDSRKSAMVNGHCLPIEGGLLASCKMG